MHSNNPVLRDNESNIHCQLLAEQPVSLVAPPSFKKRRKFEFPHDLRDIPMILPSLESNIRASFDLIMEREGIRPLIAAEADAMARLRLIARETGAITIVPPVIVQDELKNGRLIELCKFLRSAKTFTQSPRRVATQTHIWKNC